MIQFNSSNKQIQVNRGDSVDMNITAKDEHSQDYLFQIGDQVTFKIMEIKHVENVILEKTTVVDEETSIVNIHISSDDMKIGELINKPVIYWYEISLTKNNGDVSTIIGYDKQGAKEFILNPEAGNKM